MGAGGITGGLASWAGCWQRVLLILADLPPVCWVDPADPVTALPHPERAWLARMLADRTVLTLELLTARRIGEGRLAGPG